MCSQYNALMLRICFQILHDNKSRGRGKVEKERKSEREEDNELV